MSWFNIWVFIFVAAIMVPNIVFAVKCKEGFVNRLFVNSWGKELKREIECKQLLINRSAQKL